MKKKVKALIFMKEKSERLPGKNYKNIAGKPLLYWILKSLSGSKRVSEIIVNTDSLMIADLCKQITPVKIHNRPDFLLDINQFIWIHCKNLSAINYLTEKSDIFNFFWHENDKFTLTSKGFIWTYPNNEYDKNSVIVNLSAELVLEKDCYGICSDYVSQY